MIWLKQSTSMVLGNVKIKDKVNLIIDMIRYEILYNPISILDFVTTNRNLS